MKLTAILLTSFLLSSPNLEVKEVKKPIPIEIYNGCGCKIKQCKIVSYKNKICSCVLEYRK